MHTLQGAAPKPARRDVAPSEKEKRLQAHVLHPHPALRMEVISNRIMFAVRTEYGSRPIPGCGRRGDLVDQLAHPQAQEGTNLKN